MYLIELIIIPWFNQSGLPLTVALKCPEFPNSFSFFSCCLFSENFETILSVFFFLFSRPSRVWLFVTPWTAACQASLSITNSRSLLKLMSVMPSNHLVLCRPLLLSPLIFPSIRATQDGRVMVESSDKTWSAGEGNGKPRQYSTLRTPWTVWKGKKIGHWKKVSQETEY